MEGRKINTKERSCLANCINHYWGDNDRQDDIKDRDKDYEKCLAGCQICG